MHPRVEQHPPRERKIRRELEQPREGRRHVVLTPQMLQGDGAVVQRLRIVGPAHQRTIEARHGILGPFQLEQRDAPVVERLRVAGLERQRSIVARHGVLESLQVEQRIASIEERARIVRFERQRTVVAREGLVGPAEFLQRQSEVDIGRREIGPDRERRANGRDGGIAATQFVLHQAEEMKSVEMPGLPGEQFEVPSLGFGEVATPVQRQRLLKQGVGHVMAQHAGASRRPPHSCCDIIMTLADRAAIADGPRPSRGAGTVRVEIGAREFAE